MATTINIPLTTLPVGSQTFGPTPAAGIQKVDLLINRNVGSLPLNGQPATTTLELRVDLSEDGGVTWRLLFAADVPGGILQNDFPPFDTATVSEVSEVLTAPLPANAQARAILTVAGSSVSVSGTLTLS